MAVADKQKKSIEFPRVLLSPIKKFLEGEVIKWKRTEKSIKKNDPFMDSARGMHNSDEEDVDEQVGHFEAEVKTSFVKKRLVQLRKALTSIKIGKYGICENCGKMIDTDRLAVKPDATLCIDCRKDAE
jgi:RNA polymerase-binding transcription factor DksA